MKTTLFITFALIYLGVRLYSSVKRNALSADEVDNANEVEESPAGYDASCFEEDDSLLECEESPQYEYADVKEESAAFEDGREEEREESGIFGLSSSFSLVDAVILSTILNNPFRHDTNS